MEGSPPGSGTAGQTRFSLAWLPPAMSPPPVCPVLFSGKTDPRPQLSVPVLPQIPKNSEAPPHLAGGLPSPGGRGGGCPSWSLGGTQLTAQMLPGLAGMWSRGKFPTSVPTRHWSIGGGMSPERGGGVCGGTVSSRPASRALQINSLN